MPPDAAAGINNIKRTNGRRIMKQQKPRKKDVRSCHHDLIEISPGRWKCSRCQRVGAWIDGMIHWDAPIEIYAPMQKDLADATAGKSYALNLKSFIGHTTAAQQAEALEALSERDRRGLFELLVIDAGQRDEQESRQPRNWGDDRHARATTLLRNAALLHFATLHNDAREVLVRRAGMLRQTGPSVVRDAVTLSLDVRRAVQAVAIEYVTADERGGVDAK